VAWGAAAAASAQTPPGLAGSSDRPLAITADELEYERARDVYVARGDVHIERGEATLEADWVAFNPRTRQGLASGNVVVVDGPDTLRSDFLQFNVDSLEGVVFDGTLVNDDTGFRMQGEEVRRTGDETYEVDDGLFTTCRCPDPDDRDPWALTAGRADIDVEGFAVVRNAGLEVLGVPVAWLPFFAYPLKRERQSGFLLPTLGIGSRNGTRVGLPFFWAARDDVNVLLTPSWSGERGFMGTAEVDYVIGRKRDFGEIVGVFVPDDKEVEPGDPEFPFDEDRWGIEFEHVQRLPWGGLDLRAQGVVASDNDVPFDIDEFDLYRRDRFLESVVSLTKHLGEDEWSSLGAFTAVRYADDLQSPDDQDRDAFLLQRLPEVGIGQISRPAPGLQWLLPSFDVHYAHFYYRDDPRDELDGATRVDDLFLDTGIDAVASADERGGRADPNGDDFPPGPEGDGRFQEGEPLADKGHRLLVNPRLAAPFRAKWLEVYPEVGYHGTFYETDLQGFEERSLLTGRLDLRTRLRRGYTLPLGLGEGDHLLEPRLSVYGLADLGDDDDDPLFIPETAVPLERIRQLDLDTVLRDPADRIDEGAGVTLGVANRFYVRDSKGARGASGARRGRPPTRLFADLAASVEYEIDDGDPGWFVVDGSLFPGRGTQVRGVFGYDLDETNVAEGLLDLRWSSPAGHAIGLRYRFLDEIPRFFEDFRRGIDRFDEFEEGFNEINQVQANARWAVTDRWALFYRVDFSLEEGLLLTNEGGVEYISKCKCWAIQVALEDDRSQGLQLDLRYTLLGLGDDKTRPFQN